jgi:light-regulated signal transduction histidine kinase (bacteriophytochrome)
MNDSLAETGLKFFGTMSASISHEIKNRMAVINEQAGLLKDLVLLAGKGREIDLERLMRLAESLKKQVDLTDDIIKNMNRFSHTVDSFECTTDLVEVIALTAALSKRTAENKGVRIELCLPESSIRIVTAPFLVMNLIWLCLEMVMPFADMERPVTIGGEKTDTGATVFFSTEQWPDGSGSDLPETIYMIAQIVHADVILDPKEKGIRIELATGG